MGNGNFHYLKEEPEAQTFQKLNAWSVPDLILKKLGEKGKITFISEKYVYEIKAVEAVEKGQYFWFKNSDVGIERKKYIPKDLWKRKKRV